EIIVFKKAFHGRTLATMSTSGKPQWMDLFEPKVPKFVRVPINDISTIRRNIGSNTAAVMLEPIQGKTSIIPFSLEFLRDLRKLSEDASVLLILDEIQTSIDQTRRMFCYEHTGIHPDIVTVGKGINESVPLTTMLGREAVCVFEARDQKG